MTKNILDKSSEKQGERTTKIKANCWQMFGSTYFDPFYSPNFTDSKLINSASQILSKVGYYFKVYWYKKLYSTVHLSNWDDKVMLSILT